MTFYRWIIKKYAGKHCPMGDLADDLVWDDTFPKENTRKAIRAYLEAEGACQDCEDVFELAWVEYAKENKLVKESTIERRLVAKTRNHGGLAAKFVSPGLDGVPDRIILLPGGHMAFVELKAPGKKLRPVQGRRREQLEGLGFRVFVVDSVERIELVLNEIGGDAR